MNVFVQNYLEIPTITRGYLTACVLTTLLVQLDIVSPFQLYYNFNLIFFKHQYWRLITSFLFFGTFNFGFFFSLVFIYRHSRMLEEGSFRSKSADFLFMLLFGAFVMILIAPFVKLIFLGHAFTIMLVYLWSKRNPSLALNFFGIANFRAPNLPWILLGFSLVLGNPVLTDVLGIAVGHIYYYLEDVFPNLPGGFRILKTPKILIYLFDYNEYYENYLNRSQNENITENNQENNQNNEQNQDNDDSNRTNINTLNDTDSSSTNNLNTNNSTNLNDLNTANTND